MQGRFRVWLPRPVGQQLCCAPDLIIPNLITKEGETEYLKMIFRNESVIAGGGNWFVGLANQTPNDADVLADIDTEPTSQGGYARQSIVRSGTGWPLIEVINNRTVIRSAVVTFTASGADFSRTFTRLFLTDASSGTSGKLYAYSGQSSTEILVPDGSFVSFQYETNMD